MFLLLIILEERMALNDIILLFKSKKIVNIIYKVYNVKNN